MKVRVGHVKVRVGHVKGLSAWSFHAPSSN